jgi:hypothetical protein
MTIDETNRELSDAVSVGQRILELLDQQAELLARFELLTKRQGECAASNEPAEMLGVLAEREQTLAPMLMIAKELESLASRREAGRAALSESDRERLDRLAEEAQRGFERIAQADEACRSAIAGTRDRLAAELGQVAHGRSALAGYGNQHKGHLTNRFADREA